MKPNVIGDDPSAPNPRFANLQGWVTRDPDKGLEHLRRLEEASLEVSAARVVLGQ